MTDPGDLGVLTGVPLFPLNTVLFPGGPLPLRIFEPRYLAMVSRCLRDDGEFGVVLITSGAEAGDASIATSGTLARIVDWYQGPDGLLGVTARGTRRFRLHRVGRQADGLYLGDVTLLADEPAVPLPAEFAPLARLLESIMDELTTLYAGIDRRLDDATWVGQRLAEILPLPPPEKQACLEAAHPLDRLRLLKPLLRSVRTVRPQ
jgi:Lon protease-like protein